MKQRSSILLFSSLCQENDEQEGLQGTSTLEEAMTFEYDEKGKIFTDIVSKNSIAATVQTTTHLIRGQIHVRRDQRIKDELDLNENFLAMTAVSVMGPDGQTLFQAPFLAVRRSHIVWVLPEQNQSREGSS
jgi:hypothetical protein